MLLKLFIYGYLSRIPSGRRLEREAGRDVELMWLTGRLVLAVPSRFHGTYVQTHLILRRLNACRSVSDGIDEVVISV